jgi:zinc protease
LKSWKLLPLSLLLVACQQGDDTTKEPASADQADTAKVQSALPDGFELVEKVTRTGDELVIPYEKYRLDNGLTVIIHQDMSDPLAHVDVTYHVGSAREELGKSGFAHFFEHMMFQGSENVADEEHFKIVSESGGTLNGTTNFDRTNYFQTVPANQLEKMLWLEADRMGFLLDAVTQEKFEVQRETVKNERGQRVDNQPYGRLFETLLTTIYPKGHPYSWPTIGWIEDLNRVDVNDLKKFFLRWYGPNNATLTIGGSVDVIETLTLIKKYFGSIPRGPEVAMPEKPAVSLDADRYVSFEDNVNLPMFVAGYPTVHARHKDEAALDLLGEILGQGKTSILYESLVKTRFAVQASVGHACFELSCIFYAQVLPNPASGKTLADMDKAYRDALLAFEKRGVTDDDIIKFRAKAEADLIFGLQSVSGKVSQLAAFETFEKDPNFIGKQLELVRSVTKEDVMRVYNTYIKGQNAAYLSIVPNGKPEMVAKKDTFKAPIRDFVATAGVKESELDLRVAKDDFDRSVQPKAGPNPSVEIPDFWQAELKNKMKVLGAVSDETPTTAIYISLKGGHYNEPKDKAGLARLTASMLNETTQLKSNEEMSLAQQKLGSRINVSSGNGSTNIFISTLSKNLDETIDLALEKLTKPAFLEADLQRLKAQTVQSIKSSRKQPDGLANEAWLQLMYGDTVGGLSSSGLVSTVSTITVDDIKAFYNDYVKPAQAEVIVVTNLEQAQVLKSLGRMEAWTGESKGVAQTFEAPKFDPKTIYMVNKDKAAQSVIRIGKRSITRDFTGEFFKAGLMNFNLGGAFNSRINLNLREDKGYTYGAGGRFGGNKEMGTYSVGASVRADATDKSFIEFVKEISNYHKSGLTADELAFMKNAISQRDARAYETPIAKLRFMGNILTYGLDKSFVDTQADIIKNIKKEELDALAAKHLDIDTMVKLVVGDIAVLKPQFEALGYKVEEVKLAD